MKRKRSAFFILFVWVLMMALGTAVAVILWLLLTDRTSVESMKWLQAMQVLFLFIAPALAVTWLYQENPARWLQLDTSPRGRVWVFAVMLMIVMLPGINLLSHWNQQLELPSFLSGLEAWMKQREEDSAKLLEQFMQTKSLGGLLINLGLMALLPAVGEELTFRGVLLHIITNPSTSFSEPDRRKRMHLAIWVTAFVFSFVHFQFYGFVPRMLMGALFGYVLWWTGSLWVAMAMHFTNNATVTLLYFICLRTGRNMEALDAFGSGDTLWAGILSIVISIIGIYFFRRSLTMSNASSRTSAGN